MDRIRTVLRILNSLKQETNNKNISAVHKKINRLIIQRQNKFNKIQNFYTPSLPTNNRNIENIVKNILKNYNF